MFPTSESSQDLFTLPARPIEMRWASAENPAGSQGQGGQKNGGRKGSPSLRLPAGESVVLAEAAPGISGTVRRIWITISNRAPSQLRGIRLDFYWDGAETPAVSAPIGDFFGIGLGRMATFQSVFFSNPEGRSFNCCLPMPFQNGMRLVATNETAVDEPMFFYDVDYTVGDAHGPETLYLHAHFRRENPTTLRRDYELLPQVTGRGRFLGVNVGVVADQKLYARTWWGEGEVKIFLDGDTEFPTLCGTGTEDYIGTAWGQGSYAHLYQGCPYADGESLSYCFYRYHVLDPIYFQASVKATIQQIGHSMGEELKTLAEIGGPLYRAAEGVVPFDPAAPLPPGSGVLFERQDDWSSCAYFYLDRPTNDLPPLQPVSERAV